MRRDVRLLGEILGQVISESDGEDLLDDVEELRHRVIAARQPTAGAVPTARDKADDEIAALVASWPLARAETVARAFTVYFHLANLAEEHQRIRTLRERDTGAEPVRESLGAADGGLAETLGAGPRARCWPAGGASGADRASDRGQAPGASPRRCAGSAPSSTRWTAPSLGAAARTEAARRLREEIDLLWRTSPLRSQAMQPLDEVRSGTAVFDETLFRLAPSVYRALDRALQGEASGAAAAAGAGLPAVRQLDRRRPGRQPVRDRRGHRAGRARSRPITRCGRWRTRPPGSAGR